MQSGPGRFGLETPFFPPPSAVVAELDSKPSHFAGVASSNCELYTFLQLLLCVVFTNTVSPAVIR